MLSYSIPNSMVLDLFAGSGGLGIEALSRGARFAYFIENNNSACKCITENIQFTKMAERAVLLNRDVFSGIQYLATSRELSNQHFDLIFIDPPFKLQYEKKVLDLLAVQKYVNHKSLIVLETEVVTDTSSFLNEVFYLEKEKKYKTNKHLFIRKKLDEV